jgi:uncharacterized protein YdhG (YjbR/CyaY superfamily)
MAKTDFKSVDEYIAAQPEVVQDTLQGIRGIIRKALPEAEEVISYQIPAYKVPGGAAIYFAGWKKPLFGLSGHGAGRRCVRGRAGPL